MRWWNHISADYSRYFGSAFKFQYSQTTPSSSWRFLCLSGKAIMASANQVKVLAVCSLSVKKNTSSGTLSRTGSNPATLYESHMHECRQQLKESERRYILYRRSGPRDPRVVQSKAFPFPNQSPNKTLPFISLFLRHIIRREAYQLGCGLLQSTAGPSSFFLHGRSTHRYKKNRLMTHTGSKRKRTGQKASGEDVTARSSSSTKHRQSLALWRFQEKLEARH